MGDKLGAGAYGTVFKATYQGAAAAAAAAAARRLWPGDAHARTGFVLRLFICAQRALTRGARRPATDARTSFASFLNEAMSLGWRAPHRRSGRRRGGARRNLQRRRIELFHSTRFA